MALTRGRMHKFPYFKVQVYDPLTLSWRDHRKEVFDDEHSARAYKNAMPKSVKSRIVRWDENGNHPME